MTELASVPARRLAAPRWLDARLVLGVLLVLVAIVGGARVLAAADRYTVVWAAAHDLSPGQQVSPADVVSVRARLYGAGALYLSAARPFPAGYLVVRPVGAHDLLPADAVAAATPDAALRFVPVPVSDGHYDAGLTAGALVDVYVTPRSTGGAGTAGPTRLVLQGITVDGRQGGGTGFAAPAAAVTFLLSVPAPDVAALVAAVESGAIDLVDVPPTAAGSLPAAH